MQTLSIHTAQMPQHKSSITYVIIHGLQQWQDLLLRVSNSCNILMYIQQDATLHSLLYLETALHVSGGNITHHQERKQLYLQHLVFVTPLLLSAAIVEELELV